MRIFFLQEKPDIRIEPAIYADQCKDGQFGAQILSIVRYINDSILRDAVEYLSGKGVKVYASAAATGLDRVPPKYTLHLKMLCHVVDPAPESIFDTSVEIRIGLQSDQVDITDVGINIDLDLVFNKVLDHESSNKNSVVAAVFDSLKLPPDLLSKIGERTQAKYSVSDMILYRTASSVAETGNTPLAFRLLEQATENNQDFAMAYWAMAELSLTEGNSAGYHNYAALAQAKDKDHPKIPLVVKRINPTPLLKKELRSLDLQLIDKGIRYGKANLKEPGITIFVWEFDKSEVKIALKSSPTSKGNSARTFRKDHGGFFAIVGGTFERGFDGNMEPSGLYVEDGIIRKGLAAWRSGGILEIGGAFAKLTPIGKFDIGQLGTNTSALQSILFVVDPGGRNGIYGRDFAVASRAAYCTSDSGYHKFVVVKGDMTLFDFGDVLSSKKEDGGLQCETAIYLDGGPSAQASFELSGVNVEVEGGWLIPNAIVASRR